MDTSSLSVFSGGVSIRDARSIKLHHTQATTLGKHKLISSLSVVAPVDLIESWLVK
jgi:hypothetical protein